jgi:Resolvase, N terminal domain
MPIPAAQNLRMSTEHHQYSLDNQSSAIQHYAAIQGFEIVRTYSDAAKSGLNLKRRVGLRQLLQDVVSGNSPYKAVLVYDVSRWGRFQDGDEAARYEFLCKSAGAGFHVYGRTSQRLCTPVVKVPQAEWILTPNAFEPLVDQATFDAAQQILQNRTINRSEEEILESLRALLIEEGRLSYEVIKNSARVPSPSTYRHRFGGIRQTYERIGYGSSSNFEPINVRHRIQTLRDNLMVEISSRFPGRVSIIRRGGRYRTRLCCLMCAKFPWLPRRLSESGKTPCVGKSTRLRRSGVL